MTIADIESKLLGVSAVESVTVEPVSYLRVRTKMRPGASEADRHCVYAIEAEIYQAKTDFLIEFEVDP